MSWIPVRAKVSVPALRPGLLERPRLHTLLDQGLAAGARVALVSAPAGYGKTTAIAQWVRASDMRAGWLTLDEGDDEFERFFRYLVRAWETVQQSIMESAVGTLLGGINPDHERVLASFANAAWETPTPTALVLNDYHVIGDPAIQEGITHLVDHLPPHFHFVLLARSEPALALARWRARGELLDVGTADLKFSPTETQQLLGRLPDLSREDIARLHEETEGWPAGLQMSLTALQRGRTPLTGPAAAPQHFIDDFLRQEVLADLREETARFLLFTSPLERLSGPLCDEVTAGDGGQAMLEQLEKDGLFLVALDEQRRWFRYHTLFAAFLQSELQRRFAPELPAIHRRASRWLLAADFFEDAFHHALAAHDEASVVAVAERRFDLMLHIGQLRLLRRWLAQIPEAWRLRNSAIGLAEAGWLCMTGAVDACLRLVDRVEEALRRSERPDLRWHLARVITIRCLIACHNNDLSRAEPLAERALHDLPAGDQHYQATVHHSLGEAYRHAGRWEKARSHYLQVLALDQDPAFLPRSTHVYGALADVELLQGHLHAAARYWDEAQAVIEARNLWGYLPIPLTGWVAIRKAEIAYEWNERELAVDLVRRGLAAAELGGAVQSLIVGSLLAGQLALAEGNVAEAEAYLQRARPLVEQAQFASWRGRYERVQVEIWLAGGRVQTAAAWARTVLQDADGAGGGAGHGRRRLAAARALALQPDRALLEQAVNLLQDLRSEAAAAGSEALAIEAAALEALAHDRAGDRTRALAALGQALGAAEAEGYVRLFADLGLPMARLLQEARARAVRPEYTDRLIRACDADWRTGSERPLPEPLTKRETQILALLAAGLTNREIASELVISPGTVKKHTSHIYGKLGVHGRREAAAVASELGLLS